MKRGDLVRYTELDYIAPNHRPWPILGLRDKALGEVAADAPIGNVAVTFDGYGTLVLPRQMLRRVDLRPVGELSGRSREY